MQRDVYSGLLRPKKLRDLAKLYLGRSIQENGSCHDSRVDAKAAMDLYMLVKKDFDNFVAVSTIMTLRDAQNYRYTTVRNVAALPA